MNGLRAPHCGWPFQMKHFPFHAGISHRRRVSGGRNSDWKQAKRRKTFRDHENMLLASFSLLYIGLPLLILENGVRIARKDGVWRANDRKHENALCLMVRSKSYSPLLLSPFFNVSLGYLVQTAWNPKDILFVIPLFDNI